ncbi:hypothetical protein GCM10007391_01530 [Alteromonas halophila]|uniref:Uncharacterized protein n=1 Tax=Alteromonas halophila TaxID=516698 RepID=A0A918JC38_9ALTE|nr:hypothetical protein GCM10007391_01530 [Alteromonas halophila]
MLAHSIHAALESGAVDVVVVSTDDDEIARVANVVFYESTHLIS